MKKALFIIHNKVSITELLPLATGLKETGRYQVLLHIHRCGEKLEEGLAECDAAGVPYLLGERARQVLSQNASVGSVVSENGQRKTLGRLLFRQVLRLPMMNRLLEVRDWLRIYRKEIRDARRTIAEERPDILLFTESPLLGLEVALSKAAHARGIPLLVVPFYANSIMSTVNFARLHPRFEELYTTKPLFNRLVALMFPRWVFSYQGYRLFPRPTSQLLAAQLLGISQRDTWAQIDSKSIYTIAVQGKAKHEEFLAKGVPEKQLVVTGKPLDDVLAKVAAKAVVRRAALYKRLGLPNKQRMILLAVPQFAEHNYMSWEAHWQAIETLIIALTSVKDANVVLSLHPRMQRDKYVYLEDKFGIRVGDESSSYLIPLCDLFVAAGSSTIDMAICSQKPVINLEFWQPDRMYDKVEGVVTLHDEAQLVPALQRIMGDPNEYAQLKTKVVEISSIWGVIDGKAGERLVTLVDKLTGLLPNQSDSER